MNDGDIAHSIAQLPDGDPGRTKAFISQQSRGGGRFRILRPLEGGKGGMGEISVAEDSELGRRVALKQIRSDHADRQAYRAKFQVEAEITGNLEHPGIVPIYSLGKDSSGRPFYAMRLVRGDNLGQAIEAFHILRKVSRASYDSVEFRGLIDRLIDVAQAISYAHSRGVLHRDLKPGNVLVGNYGETLVIDWGLARLPQMQSNDSTDEDSNPLDQPSELKIRSGSQIDPTMHGSVMGTLGYAPPEQITGHVARIGNSSDVYGLGAILYQILTGVTTVQVRNRDTREVMDDIALGKIRSPEQYDKGIPKALSANLPEIAITRSSRSVSIG